MAIGDSLPLMNQIVSNRMSQTYGQTNPNKTTLTLEQQYSQLAQQMQQQQQPQHQLSDPYTEGSSILSRCSQLVREKIQNDSRYQQSDKEFETIIQQYLYSQLIPIVLQSQAGSTAAERWCATIKQLESEYTQEEVNRAKTTDMLLNDPVVVARLQELQNQINQQAKPIVKQTNKQVVQQIQTENIEEIEANE